LGLSDAFKSKPRPEREKPVKKGRGYKGWHAILKPAPTNYYWNLHFIDPDGKQWNWQTHLYGKKEADAKRQARKYLKRHVDRLLEQERQAARKTIVL
jgi:hypothetical protein